MKKVLLLAATNDFVGNLNVSDFTAPLAPPMGNLALGSYLTAHGVPVELIDVAMDFGFGFTVQADALVTQQVADYIRVDTENIGWVGISMLSNSGNGLKLAEAIRAQVPELPILLGGYFPTTAYRELLAKYPAVTAIVRGDGEAAALEISQCLDRGQSFLSSHTPNLVWQENGEIHVNDMLQMKLTDLPTLDFQLLRHPADYQIYNLMTSRGCPFKCNYCLESTMRSYAAYPLDWVSRQLDQLESIKPGARVFIYDPIFGFGREHTSQLLDILRQHSFTYAVESRVDVMTPEQVAALRGAKVDALFLGIESASPATLLRMHKVNTAEKADVYPKLALPVLEACFQYDVTPVGGFMLGFPGDTEADYQATLALAQAAGELHDRITAQSGRPTGFAPFAFHSKIYAGSALAQKLQEQLWPDLELQPEPFIGEHMVRKPSAGITIDTTRRYQKDIVAAGRLTPLAVERLGKYFVFSMKAYCEAHPELTGSDGVVRLGESFRHFTTEFRVDAISMRFEKAKPK